MLRKSKSQEDVRGKKVRGKMTPDQYKNWDKSGHVPDEEARPFGKKVWKMFGIEAVDHEDQYKVDLRLFRYGLYGYCELEKSYWWKSGEFLSKYPSEDNPNGLITVPERKGPPDGSLVSPDGLPVFWMQFNRDFTWFVLTKAEIFLNSKPKHFDHGHDPNEKYYYTDKYMSKKVG